jgi:AcrR family transcriptional regulator
MARPGARPRKRPSGSARARVVAAAVETLKREGFAGTSAREVARTGGFTQGVVFYHFDGMPDLLLAALDETSRQRLERYEAAVAGVDSLPELVAVAGKIFREDLAAGHVKVLAELIAASSGDPDLGRAIRERIAPWIDFTHAAIERVVTDSPVAALLPTRELAFGIVALYLGLELLTSLDGDHQPADSLFDSADVLAGALAPFLAPPQEDPRG